jgi:hypothetical protein
VTCMALFQFQHSGYSAASRSVIYYFDRTLRRRIRRRRRRNDKI